MILSFNPHIPGDLLLPPGPPGTESPEVRRLMKKAQLVVVGQNCRASFYYYCRSLAKEVFPNYDYRFAYRGKMGTLTLWKELDLPHVPTLAFTSVKRFKHLLDGRGLAGIPFPWPWVIKGNRGGGGALVYRVRNWEELERTAARLRLLEKKGLYGFVVQKYVPHQGKELRVVVIGSRLITYWRCQRDIYEFRNNVCRGAVINYEGDIWLQERALEGVRHLCARTGINLAALDILFDLEETEPRPLFNEINYNFGLRGLKNFDNFLRLVIKAVEDCFLQVREGSGKNLKYPSSKD